MKRVKMMILETCPYCTQAFEMMETLKKAHPAYEDIPIEVIDEEKEAEKIQGYQYWYVPTFFVDDVKIHEGVPSMDKIERVFIEALK